MTIAKWDGVSAYGYSGNGQNYVLNRSALFGPNGPFTYAATNVVKMWAEGASGTVIRSNLIFHKVQTTGFPQVSFGASRGNVLVSGYTSGASVCDPVYDIPRPSSGTYASTTVQFYGF